MRTVLAPVTSVPGTIRNPIWGFLETVRISRGGADPLIIFGCGSFLCDLQYSTVHKCYRYERRGDIQNLLINKFKVIVKDVVVLVKGGNKDTK